MFVLLWFIFRISDQRLITELETSNRELLARAARAEMDISDVKCRAERTEAALRQALDVAGQNELTLRSNLHKMLQDADARVGDSCNVL